MFGFQRIGDLAWAAGDQRARGFLLGGTAGRTTLNGEGLQHEDGHSHLMSSTVPNCISYDPTFAYEVAVIIQDGLRRMYKEQEDVFYYLTLMNENYQHPAMPKGAEEGIIKGMYRLSESSLADAKGGKKAPRVQLLGSGTILREVIAAQAMLEQDFGVAADIWSCPSFTELRRQCLDRATGPVVAATDYMKMFADQIRPFIHKHFVVLGTDGFGRSDTREKLRGFFEVDRRYVTVAALKALADEGTIPVAKVAEAIGKYGLNPDKPDPTTV
jgi:pyruvate dehydrogenase E1 component